jgi:4-amino-4-deoxy-L-arabinose transferase-like glycosyltransferase
MIETGDMFNDEVISSSSSRRDWLGAAIVALLVAGAVLRVWILVGSLGTLNSDDATVGLMARHLLDGEVRSFFWGQDYGGTPQLFLVAVALKLFGSSPLTLKIPTILLSAAASWLVWRVGRRTIGEPAARVAAALFWVWPPIFVWFSTSERLFYFNTLVLGLVVVLCALRMVQGGTRLDPIALGFAAGVGWWATVQIAYFLIPVGIWLTVRLGRRILSVAPAFPAAVLGALPWIVHNAHYGLISLKLPQAQPVPNGFIDNARAFFRTGLPIALGLRLPFSGRWILPAVAVSAYLLLVAGFLFGLAKRQAGTGLLFLIVALYPFLFAVSPLSWFVADARYLVFLAPFAALLIGRVLAGDGARTVLPAAGLALALALSVGGLVAMERQRLTTLGAPDIKIPEDFAPLMDTLEREGILYVYANYWIAYRLTFESDERIIAQPFFSSRYPPYEAAVRRSQRAAYLFISGSASIRRFETAITRKGIAYQRITPGAFTVFVPERTITPQELGGLPGEM